MKKLLALTFCALTALSFTSCGKKDDPTSGKTIIDVTPSEVETKIKDALGENGYFCNTDKTEDQLKNMDLNFDKIESYVAKEAQISSINPDTIIVLKVKDDYAAEAIDKLNEHYARVVKYGTLYPFCVAKVENARLFHNSDIVALIIGGDVRLPEDAKEGDDVKLAQKEYAKVDAAWEDLFGEKPRNLAVIPDVSDR